MSFFIFFIVIIRPLSSIIPFFLSFPISSVAVSRVIPKSPADKAGLRDGDIILELDGKKIDESHTLAGAIGQHGVGDEVTLKVFSKGATREVRVKLEEFQEINEK